MLVLALSIQLLSVHGRGVSVHSLSTMLLSLIPSLWLDVCYNFFYREPATVSSSRPIEKLDGAHNQDQGLELLMRYFVGSELGVSNVLQRHFCWTSNSLWFEEIPNATDQSKTFFCMGGKDIIVNTEVSDKSLSHAHYLTKLVACQTLSYIPRRSKKHLVWSSRNTWPGIVQSQSRSPWNPPMVVGWALKTLRCFCLNLLVLFPLI